MTDFVKLKAQVKTRLQEIVKLEIAKSEAIANCKYTVVRGQQFFVGAEL